MPKLSETDSFASRRSSIYDCLSSSIPAPTRIRDSASELTIFARTLKPPRNKRSKKPSAFSRSPWFTIPLAPSSVIGTKPRSPYIRMVFFMFQMTCASSVALPSGWFSAGPISTSLSGSQKYMILFGYIFSVLPRCAVRSNHCRPFMSIYGWIVPGAQYCKLTIILVVRQGMRYAAPPHRDEAIR